MANILAAFGVRMALGAIGSRRDPGIYAAVAALVTVVSLVATFMPARRAKGVDPMIALRAE